MRPKKEINIQVGEQVKRAREKRGLTQEQFAEMIDKTPQFVSDLERGVSGISIETLKLICEKLSVSCDSILFSGSKSHDRQIGELTDKFRRMSESQFYVMEQITDAFICASSAAEKTSFERRKNGARDCSLAP